MGCICSLCLSPLIFFPVFISYFFFRTRDCGDNHNVCFPWFHFNTQLGTFLLSKISFLVTSQIIKIVSCTSSQWLKNNLSEFLDERHHIQFSRPKRNRTTEIQRTSRCSSEYCSSRHSPSKWSYGTDQKSR